MSNQSDNQCPEDSAQYVKALKSRLAAFEREREALRCAYDEAKMAVEGLACCLDDLTADIETEECFEGLVDDIHLGGPVVVPEVAARPTADLTTAVRAE